MAIAQNYQKSFLESYQFLLSLSLEFHDTKG